MLREIRCTTLIADGRGVSLAVGRSTEAVNSVPGLTVVSQRRVQQIFVSYVSLQVSHQLGRPINRKFHAPRKIEFVEQGWGLNIAPPPEPRPPRVRLNHATAHSPVWLLPVCTCQLDGHLFVFMVWSWTNACILTAQ